MNNRWVNESSESNDVVYSNSINAGRPSDDREEIEYIYKELSDLKETSENTLMQIYQVFEDPEEDATRIQEDIKFLGSQVAKSVELGTIIYQKNEQLLQQNAQMQQVIEFSEQHQQELVSQNERTKEELERALNEVSNLQDQNRQLDQHLGESNQEIYRKELHIEELKDMQTQLKQAVDSKSQDSAEQDSFENINNSEQMKLRIEQLEQLVEQSHNLAEGRAEDIKELQQTLKHLENELECEQNDKLDLDQKCEYFQQQAQKFQGLNVMSANQLEKSKQENLELENKCELLLEEMERMIQEQNAQRISLTINDKMDNEYEFSEKSKSTHKATEDNTEQSPDKHKSSFISGNSFQVFDKVEVLSRLSQAKKMKASIVIDSDCGESHGEVVRGSMGIRSSRSQSNLFLDVGANSETEMYRNDFDASSQANNFIYNFKDFGTHIEINSEQAKKIVEILCTMNQFGTVGTYEPIIKQEAVAEVQTDVTNLRPTTSATQTTEVKTASTAVQAEPRVHVVRTQTVAVEVSTGTETKTNDTYTDMKKRSAPLVLKDRTKEEEAYFRTTLSYHQLMNKKVQKVQGLDAVKLMNEVRNQRIPFFKWNEWLTKYVNELKNQVQQEQVTPQVMALMG